MEIDKELMMIGVEFETKEEVLKAMGTQLYEEGYVTGDFIENVLDREEKFPTGLPTVPHAIAIPHTDTDKVIKSKIAFATLKKPVSFSNMGNSDDQVDVKIIFMLALNEPGKQLTTLQNLIEMVQNEQIVANLESAKNIDECAKILADFEARKN